MTQPSGGSRRKWTWSAWVKKSSTGANQSLCVAYQDSANWTSINFETSDQLNFYEYQGNSVVGQKKLSMVSRDTNGWYHFMIIWDSENTTADDRMIIYVNGVRQTAFSASTNPAVNTSTAMNRNNYPVRIGTNNSNNYFDGLMSHVNFCGGQALAPTVFGETDATTGEWKIISDPTFTPGIGGYSILKNGNSLTDQSANSNNFSLGGGTLTDTKDCPSNVFDTMNALSKGSDAVLSKGSTILRNDQNTNANVLGTIALGNGKYYWETYKHGGGLTGLGLTLASIDGSDHAAIHSYRVNYYQDGYIYQNGFGLSDINTGVTYADTDIIGISVDTENGTIKFYKNGALVNNSSQTNSVFTLAQNELIPFWYVNNGGEWRANMGNGYFGSSQISNAGTNASNNGIFEYDVQPTDATALSTRGLNL